MVCTGSLINVAVHFLLSFHFLPPLPPQATILRCLIYAFVHMPSCKMYCRASLVAQWLRIRLPMQGTQVRALVREDPTCHGATKPVRHNY